MTNVQWARSFCNTTWITANLYLLVQLLYAESQLTVLFSSKNVTNVLGCLLSFVDILYDEIFYQVFDFFHYWV